MSLSERLGFAAAPPTGAVALRVGLYLAVAVWAVLLDVGELVDVATLHWEPRSILRLLPGPPGRGVVEAARAVLVCGALASAAGVAGWLARGVTAGAAVLVMGLNDAALGGLSHNYALATILLVAMVPAPLAARGRLGTARAVDEPAGRSPRWAWPVGLARIIVVLVYVSAAVSKLRSAGLGWVDADSFQRWAWVKLDRMADPSSLGLAVARDDTLALVSAAGVLAVQLSIVLVLVWPRFRPVAVIGVVAFHALSWVTLGLDFWLMAWVACLPLIDWEGLRQRYAPGLLRPAEGS